MRILFFSYAYPNPYQPGLGTFNRAMIAGLAQQHAVRVVSPVGFLQTWRRPQTPPDSFRAVCGVPAEYVPYYYTPKFLRARYDAFLWWSVRDRLRAAIREFRPDLVLSYWAHPDGAVAVRAAHEAGVPGVVMVGGSDVLLLARSGERRRVILQTLHAADAVVAVSRDIAATLDSDGLPASRLHVVPRGIDRNVFCPGARAAARRELGLAADRPIVIGVGRLVPVKGWFDWLNACRLLREQGLQPACYVLGEGPLRAALQRMIREQGLCGMVELRGAQPQVELARWYRAADLTLLSSHSEGIPNVLLETLACGGAFVATAVGGVPEIADPLHDRLVPAQQPAALASAVAERLAQPVVAAPRRWEPDSLADAARRLGRVLEGVRYGGKAAHHERDVGAAAARAVSECGAAVS